VFRLEGAQTRSLERSKARADERDFALAPIIAEIQATGITTPYSIAAALTRRGVPTARGYRVWTDCPVRNLLKRLDRLAADGRLHASHPDTLI
jgi:hypothetical protein